MRGSDQLLVLSKLDVELVCYVLCCPEKKRKAGFESCDECGGRGGVPLLKKLS